FAVRGITDRGQENACAVDQRTLDTSIEAFYAQNQSDPADLAALTGGTDPILKDIPRNFDFVEANDGVAALETYTFPPNTWGNSTAAAVTIDNADSAVFFPLTGGDCDVTP
ncbi:MAG TPA: hypothetical protein VES40_05545, partial [Ilumatobacteraceae bacterium]|nr:hypothetical protein [Ilumatobacteraceae bacterium]